MKADIAAHRSHRIQLHQLSHIQYSRHNFEMAQEYVWLVTGYVSLSSLYFWLQQILTRTSQSEQRHRLRDSAAATSNSLQRRRSIVQEPCEGYSAAQALRAGEGPTEPH